MIVTGMKVNDADQINKTGKDKCAWRGAGSWLQTLCLSVGSGLQFEGVGA